jgi:alkylation response protein AidB-like acyl-CoA dehydrogenase
MLRETVKQFCLKEIAPHAEEWDEAGIFPRELFKTAADLGLFGIRIDPRWGGSGLDWWATAAYLEGLSYANNGGVAMALMVQSDITLPVLEELGSDDQKEEFLKPAVAGDYIAALGISEPGGGSDVANLKTRADIDGNDFVICELNRGFYYTMINFQGERLAAALGAVYKMERALEYAINYGKERQAFGQPIGSFQVWRHRFAEHLSSIEAAKWLSYRALDLMNRGEKCTREITMAKLFASELDQKVMYDCMQIMGGFAYTTEYPIGRAWRDARLNTIGAGTSEIMKEIIAKDAKL